MRQCLTAHARYSPAVRSSPSGGGASGEHDAVYVPHLSWITGDLDTHDVVMPADFRPIFVSSLFSCLAGVSDGFSFRPLWRPPFITRLAPEDRCHLNGLACDPDGQPRYVTLEQFPTK